MANEDIIDNEQIKRNVPKWVITFCATLMFLSVFINSIGLNLMQINGALTNVIIRSLEAEDNTRYQDEIDYLQARLDEQALEIELLTELAHPPKD